MPRFVVVRKVDKDFDVENFFEKLHIQSNNKTNRPICGVTEIENTSLNIAYAQFENYTDWKIALGMSNEQLKIETIPSTKKKFFFEFAQMILLG